MSSTTRNLITRLAVGASLALLAAGCGSGPASVPSALTRVSYPGVFGPTPDPLISGPYTISGVVTESGRPIAGANVNAFVNQGNFGYSYMWAYGALLTDGSGRYRMTGLPTGVRVWFQVYKVGLIRFGGRVNYADLVSSSFVEESLQALGGIRMSTWRSLVAAGERPVAI